MADLHPFEITTRSWTLMTFLFVISSLSAAVAAADTNLAPDDVNNNNEHLEGSRKCSPCANLEEIGCKCKHYEYMSKGIVRQFYNIEKCSGITQVPNISIGCSNHKLLMASFSNNPLNTIPPSAFQGIRVLNNERFLSELRLSNASLTSIDPNAFYGMQGFFMALDLSHNLLTTLPEAITALQGLEKLLLNDNRLKMESFEELGKRNNRSEHFAEVQVIDLSNNQLIGIPEVVPTSGSTRLQEISLHGNPITQDLSSFVSLLSQYPKLEKITWPLKTMRCSCLTLPILARKLDSLFNFRAIYIAGRDGPFLRWKPVTCDRYSEPPFIDMPVGFLSDHEVARVCLGSAGEPLNGDVAIGKTLISSTGTENGIASSSSSIWNKFALVVLLPLLELSVLLLT